MSLASRRRPPPRVRSTNGSHQRVGSVVGRGPTEWACGARADHDGDYYVDRHRAPSLALVVTILALSIVDAVITIHLLDHGCHEINPLMAWLLEWGVVPFLLGKYVLTATGMPVLLLFKNFRMFGTRFRVGYLVPIVVALYVVLLAYQWSLLREHAQATPVNHVAARAK